jgi:transposase
MISFTSQQRYFLYPSATDMRKSFNGLGGIVNREMGGGLLSGDVFIFINRRRNRIKLLVWDRSGFVIYYKRLEEGTFEVPELGVEAGKLEMKWEELVLILEGIRLDSVRRRKRYSCVG